MPFPSINFTFWLCVCLPPSLLLTLWEVQKEDHYQVPVTTSNSFIEKLQYLRPTMHWRTPNSIWDMTDVESLLFAVYAGYLIILVMCYLVIKNIHDVNREMEKTIHDANEEIAAAGLLQLEDSSLPDVQQVNIQMVDGEFLFMVDSDFVSASEGDEEEKLRYISDRREEEEWVMVEEGCEYREEQNIMKNKQENEELNLYLPDKKNVDLDNKEQQNLALDKKNVDLDNKEQQNLALDKKFNVKEDGEFEKCYQKGQENMESGKKQLQKVMDIDDETITIENLNFKKQIILHDTEGFKKDKKIVESKYMNSGNPINSEKENCLVSGKYEGGESELKNTGECDEKMQETVDYINASENEYIHERGELMEQNCETEREVIETHNRQEAKIETLKDFYKNILEGDKTHCENVDQSLKLEEESTIGTEIKDQNFKEKNTNGLNFHQKEFRGEEHAEMNEQNQENYKSASCLTINTVNNELECCLEIESKRDNCEESDIYVQISEINYTTKSLSYEEHYTTLETIKEVYKEEFENPSEIQKSTALETVRKNEQNLNIPEDKNKELKSSIKNEKEEESFSNSEKAEIGNIMGNRKTDIGDNIQNDKREVEKLGEINKTLLGSSNGINNYSEQGEKLSKDEKVKDIDTYMKNKQPTLGCHKTVGNDKMQPCRETEDYKKGHVKGIVNRLNEKEEVFAIKSERKPQNKITHSSKRSFLNVRIRINDRVKSNSPQNGTEKGAIKKRENKKDIEGKSGTTEQRKEKFLGTRLLGKKQPGYVTIYKEKNQTSITPIQKKSLGNVKESDKKQDQQKIPSTTRESDKKQNQLKAPSTSGERDKKENQQKAPSTSGERDKKETKQKVQSTPGESGKKENRWKVQYVSGKIDNKENQQKVQSISGKNDNIENQNKYQNSAKEMIDRKEIQQKFQSTSGAIDQKEAQQNIQSTYGETDTKENQWNIPSIPGESNKNTNQEKTPSTSGESNKNANQEKTPSTSGESNKNANQEKTPSTSGECNKNANQEKTPSTSGESNKNTNQEKTPSTSGESYKNANQEKTPSTSGESYKNANQEKTPSTSGESNKRETQEKVQNTSGQRNKKIQATIREKFGTLTNKVEVIKDKFKGNNFKTDVREDREEEDSEKNVPTGSNSKNVTKKVEILESIFTRKTIRKSPVPSVSLEKLEKGLRNQAKKEYSASAVVSSSGSEDDDDYDGENWDEEGLNEWLLSTW